MGKGDKQRSNREAKKPKADKKVAPLPAGLPKTAADTGKSAKPKSK